MRADGKKITKTFPWQKISATQYAQFQYSGVCIIYFKLVPFG